MCYARSLPYLLSILMFSLVPASGQGAAKPLFSEMPPAETGLAFTHQLVDDHPLAYLYHSGYACGGVCLGDVNGDELPDVFVASGPDANALFLNRGSLQFERSEEAGVDGKDAWAAGAVMADVDGDGDLDIYVCNYNSPNQLYLNDGGGKFTESAEAAGLAFVGPSLSPVFSDLDGDGDLDLFLVTNRMYSPTGYPFELAWERGVFDSKARMKDEYAPFFRLVQPPWAERGADPFIQEYGHPDRLFINEGLGKAGRPQFSDATKGSGIAGVDGHGLSALIFDVNDDGRPDVYVANDYIDADCLWINQGPGDDGKIRFKDESAKRLPYTPWFSMGSDVADVNNDGRLDFFVGDMAATTHFKAKTSMGSMAGMSLWVLRNAWPRQAMRNCLFVNSGTDLWQEAAFLGGVARSDWTWSVRFADYDLDGRTDLFLTNGIARTFSDSDLPVSGEMRTGHNEWEIYKEMPEMRERNRAFRNRGALKFEDTAAAWGLDFEGMSYGAASGDLDADGDVDLVVCNLTENLSLYRNDSLRPGVEGAHWLSVRLDPVKGRTALGSVVTIKTASGVQTRLHNPMTGFLSSNEPVVHFGLGDSATVAEIRVRWPSGKESVLERVKGDRAILLTEPTEVASPPPSAASTAPLLVENSAALGLSWKHEELIFDDYRREFLLPGKLSQFGPGIAVGDANGDKIDDVYLCGAARQAGRLFLGTAKGAFVEAPESPWLEHADCEEMTALFFDADRDGDTDLYVASGSNEWEAGAARYRNHLYLNETKPGGQLRYREAAAGSVPDLLHSSSCVLAGDYDRDGDLDLFVGSRSVPGAYPVTPDSVLLRNDSSKAGECRFTAVTAEIEGLEKVGLVTSGLWSDVDGDGWSDLLVATEWGPIHLFRNEAGTLRKATEPAGLAELSGWWNSIVGGDFDRDGDMDYAVLNAGLNTKYGQPSTAKPLYLYRGDMDGNGSFDLVEAKPATEGELPVRGRSCSSQAMPALLKKFSTYKAFAASTLDEIYEPESLRGSLKVSANTLESGIFYNESKPGAPKFTFKALPQEAQISPGFGATATDLNGDGWCDLAFAQNLYTREAETGLWRGGAGTVLFGGEDGLAPADSSASGFIVPGDGKGLALIEIGGRPGLIVLQNDDRLLAFTKSPVSVTKNRSLAVRLSGSAGNPTAVGARIRLLDGGRVIALAELTAGNGYQSQSSATAFLTIPIGLKAPRLAVRWPDGSESEAPVPDGSVVELAPR